MNIKALFSSKAKNLKAAALVATLPLISSVATAAPDATTANDVNTSAQGTTSFIIGLLQGEIGYALALIAFALGVFTYFKTKDLLGTLTCFGIAILVVVVPSALEGFFNAPT